MGIEASLAANEGDLQTTFQFVMSDAAFVIKLVPSQAASFV